MIQKRPQVTARTLHAPNALFPVGDYTRIILRAALCFSEMVLWAYETGLWVHGMVLRPYQMALWVYGTVLRPYQMALWAYGTVLRSHQMVPQDHHRMLLHRSALSVSHWSPPGLALLRSLHRSWQLRRGAPRHSSNRK